jgi:ribonuclease T1
MNMGTRRNVSLLAWAVAALVVLAIGQAWLSAGLPPAGGIAAPPASALAQFPDEERRAIEATVDLIRAGGPFPYAKDDTTFGNREDLLPERAAGYYREYTVETPGSPDRGARRIVAGRDGELYYTRDHYHSFMQIE